MSTTFQRLHPRLKEAIVRRLGWSSLRPVQEEAGAALLSGHNAVILAPTAGGKTEASMFPALSRLCAEQPAGVGVLYIAPIKALLNNQAERLGTYTEMVGLRRFVWHGDVNASARRRFLNNPAELLMTTPESLEVMLVSPRVPAHTLFASLSMVVIDEIHAMAGTDRGAHLMSVLERLAALSGRDVQRVGLSATVGNPEAILTWLGGSSKRPGVVVNPPAPPARRALLVLHDEELTTLARGAARIGQGQKSLLFCQSRSTTEAVAAQMRASDIEVFVHHSSVSTEERELAEATFHKGGKSACIVCTSTLELGIDVGDLDKVLQINATSTVGSFLQRMGRTGRRQGSVANTMFLCEPTDAVVQACAIIALARRGWVEDVHLTDRCWPVLVHQLMAMILATGKLDPQGAWERLRHVPDFGGVTQDEYQALLKHLEAHDFVYDPGDGLLAMGGAAEKAWGRRNFMELYAVFSSPKMFQVETVAGRALGALDQDFVDDFEEATSAFTLAGRRWQVEQILWKERVIRVSPALTGKRPSWGGYAPQFLGFDLCQAMRDVLQDTDTPSFLHASARDVLTRRRQSMAPLLAEGGLWDEGDHLTWWTFAGGRINGTLRRLLRLWHPQWTLVHDNFSLRIQGVKSGLSDFVPSFDRLAQPQTWQRDAPHWDQIAADLPNYRLSKFQRALPAWAAREMVADFLLDRNGAGAFCVGPERT